VNFATSLRYLRVKIKRNNWNKSCKTKSRWSRIWGIFRISYLVRLGCVKTKRKSWKKKWRRKM